MFRLFAGVLLGLWLGVAFAITLREAHPLPGQVVNDNSTPFATIRIYLANLDSAFWIAQGIGNLLLLLPVGLLGPIALPWLNRWWRVLLVALILSACIEAAQLWIPERSADVDDVDAQRGRRPARLLAAAPHPATPEPGEPLLGPD